MPKAYQTAHVPRSLRRGKQFGLAIPLAGITQIPADVHQAMTYCGEHRLTADQIERAAAAIEQGKQEIRQRHLDRLRGTAALSEEPL